jgi:hypothetical protein
MMHATRATSFTGITTVTKTLDGHFVSSSGATIDISQVECSLAAQRLLNGKGRYAQRAVSGVGGSGRRFEYARIYGRDRLEQYLDEIRTGVAVVDNTGGFPGYYRFGSTLNAGTGGTGGGDGTSYDSPTSTLQSGASRITGLFKTPAESSVSVWGTDPYLSFWMLANGAGAMNADIAELYSDRGTEFIPLSADDYDASRAYADLFVESRTFTSLQHIGVSGAVVGAYALIDFDFVKKVAMPTLTLPAASTLEQYNAAGRDPTAISALGTSLDRFMLKLDNAGIVAGDNHTVRVKSGQSATFLFDVNF